MFFRKSVKTLNSQLCLFCVVLFCYFLTGPNEEYIDVDMNCALYLSRTEGRSTKEGSCSFTSQKCDQYYSSDHLPSAGAAWPLQSPLSKLPPVPVSLPGPGLAVIIRISSLHHNISRPAASWRAQCRGPGRAELRPPGSVVL